TSRRPKPRASNPPPETYVGTTKIPRGVGGAFVHLTDRPVGRGPRVARWGFVLLAPRAPAGEPQCTTPTPRGARRPSRQHAQFAEISVHHGVRLLLRSPPRLGGGRPDRRGADARRAARGRGDVAAGQAADRHRRQLVRQR